MIQYLQSYTNDNISDIISTMIYEWYLLMIFKILLTFQSAFFPACSCMLGMQDRIFIYPMSKIYSDYNIYHLIKVFFSSTH